MVEKSEVFEPRRKGYAVLLGVPLKAKKRVEQVKEDNKSKNKAEAGAVIIANEVRTDPNPPHRKGIGGRGHDNK